MAFGAAPFEPHHDQQPGDEDRGEDRGDDAEAQRDRKAAHRPRAHGEQDHRGDEGGDVGVDDRRPGLFIAKLDGARRALGGFAAILADALEHQHVGIDRHADGQHDAGDPRQGQRRADGTQQTEISAPMLIISAILANSPKSP
jgi:hypothetical protein